MPDSELKFSIIEGSSFYDSQELRETLVSLVDKSYVDVNLLIDRIYSANDIAFLAYINKTVAGVLICGCREAEVITVEGQKFTPIYNGYAATDLRFRNQRIMQKLIAFATENFNQRIRLSGSRLLFYAITSNPFALRAYRKVSSYMEPFPDGSFSKKGSYLVSSLKKQLGLTIQDGAHPFKFTTSLPQRYSAFERVNMINAPTPEKTLLQTLGVVESIGDRVILFWIPDGSF